MNENELTKFEESLDLKNTVGIKLNFSNYLKVRVCTQEIRDSLLTGNYGRNHLLRPANIVLSRVLEFYSDDAKLEYVDFKDSYVSKSNFTNTSFDYAAIINCEFDEVVFKNCTFHNVSITGTSFSAVKFVNCKLDHMVIESCHFRQCQFIECTTTNKLFEYCLFSGTRFEKIVLQMQTIIGNFGLTSSSLENCRIRDKSKDEEYQYINPSEFEDGKTLTTLEQFKLEYFVNENCVTQGSSTFDDTFVLANWVGSAQIPLTFTNLLSLYLDFLRELYDTGRIFLFPLLKLHTLTGMLTETQDFNHNTRTIIQGIHSSLSEYTEEFLLTLSKISRDSKNPLILLVEGPLEKDHYYQALRPAFSGTNASISKIIKHNSPNELFISWNLIADIIPMLGLLLATRFKIEIIDIKQQITAHHYKKIEFNTPSSGALIAKIKPFQLQLGMDDENEHLYGIKLKSLFPGDLLVDLGLHFSMKKMHDVRKILLRILGNLDRE